MGEGSLQPFFGHSLDLKLLIINNPRETMQSPGGGGGEVSLNGPTGNPTNAKVWWRI